MTELVQRAIAALQQLTPDSQDAIAARVLEEIEANLAWERALAKDPDFLLELVDEAEAEIRAGRTIEGGWDEP